MPTITRGFYRWIFHRGTTLQDFADRLSHFWTFALLLVFGAIISWKQGYNEPMVCWTPAEFTNAMVRYTHSHCWNSHYIQYRRDVIEALEMLNRTPFSGAMSDLRLQLPMLTYDYPKEASLLTEYSTTTTLYQWLPLLLVFMALLFKLPNLVLYCCHGYSGLRFDKLNGFTEGHAGLTIPERVVATRQISRYVYNWCNQGCNVSPWRFLSVVWLLTKVLYFINIVTQMSYLDRYLRTTYPTHDKSTSYGDAIIDNFFSNNGSAWKISPLFPRQVLCDFQTVRLVNVHRYTVQCDLPMNEYSEVAFMFIWVWFLFVAIITSLSLAVWCIKLALPIFRQRYIWKMLQISEEFAAMTSSDSAKFADWLGEDGVMALKLIGSNSSDLVVSDVICHMWRRRQVEAGTSYIQIQGKPESIYQSGYPGISKTTYEQKPPESVPMQPVDSSAPPFYPSAAIESKLD